MESEGKKERLGPISIRDCESTGAEKGGPNVRELVMKSPKDGHREGEQDTGVRSRGDGSLQKREKYSD